jgi:hypothetical protein
MNARLERKLRLLAVIMAVGTVAGLAVNFAQELRLGHWGWK